MSRLMQDYSLCLIGILRLPRSLYSTCHVTFVDSSKCRHRTEWWGRRYKRLSPEFPWIALGQHFISIWTKNNPCIKTGLAHPQGEWFSSEYKLWGLGEAQEALFSVSNPSHIFPFTCRAILSSSVRSCKCPHRTDSALSHRTRTQRSAGASAPVWTWPRTSMLLADVWVPGRRSVTWLSNSPIPACLVPRLDPVCILNSVLSQPV